MKKYAFSFVLLAVAVFCFPQLYGVEDESTNQEIYVTFINLTDTQAYLTISEKNTESPYTYVPIKEINLASGRIKSTSLFISLNNDNRATLYIVATGGKGYGQTGSNIEIDIAKSSVYNIELTESWSYPGDGFWYIEPFRVIKPKVQK